jgi:polysaccharide pyruvyl transferase WcaK-like protein
VRTKKKPRVAIWGWYGYKNTGDDALAATIAWGLQEFLAPRRLDMIATERLVLGRSAPVRYLRAVRGLSRIQHYVRIALADLHIIGGGSGLHDNCGLGLLRLRLALIRANALLGGRTAGIGMSLGPIRTPGGAALLRRVLDRSVLMCVRDRRSVDMARSFDADLAAKVRLTMDPAVLVDRVGLPPARRLGRREGPLVLVSPCDYHRIYHGESGGDEVRRRRLGECLRRVCDETGAFVRLLVMNGSGHIGDEAACRAIAEFLPHDRVEIVGYDPNPLFAFQVIQDSDLVLGMRLHSLIYAYAASVPMVVLNYHVKVEDFVRMVGGDERWMVDAHDFEPGTLARLVADALAAPRESLLAALPVAEACEQAISAFQYLAEVVGPSDP